MSKKILIADSDPLFPESLSTKLKETCDCDIITAFDGVEAFNKARKEEVALIIIEENTAFIDGFKFCRLLKFDKRYENLPVILLTSHIEEANKELAKEVKADEYLLHSVDENLLSKITNYVK